MRIAIIHFLTFLWAMQACGMSPQLDSLKQLLSDQNPDGRSTQVRIDIARSYLYFNVDSAVTHAEKAVGEARSRGQQQLELTASTLLTKSYITRGDFDNALDLTKKALFLTEGQKWPEERAQLLALTGYVLRRKGDSEGSEAKYNECLSLSRDTGYPYGIALALKGLGDLSERKGAYVAARDHYNDALVISLELEDTELQSVILNAIGIIYDYQGDFDNALEYYLRALELCEKSGNLVKAAGICSNVASLQFSLEKDIVALHYYKKALRLARQSFSKTMEADALQGMFVVYKNMGDLENAARSAFEDLELRTRMGDTRGLSFAYKNLGVYYQETGDFKNAEIHYKKALEYAIQTDQKIKVAVLNLQIGRLLTETNRGLESLDYLKRALDITKEINALREEGMVYEDMAITYARLGMYDQAFEYQKKYTQAHKELLTQNIHDQTVRMQTAYETRQRDERIKNLENEAILKEQVLVQSRKVRNLSMLGVGSLILISFLFYNRSRLKHKGNMLLLTKNREIQNQSDIIAKSLAEKEILIKEIHHRVKNNLQIISSLLDLQSRKITDHALLESINEGKNRVEAMSLIHQNLYQNEGLTSIVMQRYLEQLLDHLSVSFRSSDKEIAHEVHAGDTVFEIDTAIPVGLIVNELVSNAYKHAFKHMKRGLIKVDLSAAGNGRYMLTVSDNGQGIDASIDLLKIKSLGLKLVNSLARKQLRGEIHMTNSPGCRFDISFSEISKNE